MKETNKKISFIPGPSSLYPTVKNHIMEALESGVPEYSHRSDYFKHLYSNTLSTLRLLLHLPDDFHIIFTSSATEIWEHSLNNFVKKSSLHLVNGAFGERFFQFAQLKNIHVQKIIPKQHNVSVRVSDIIQEDIESPELIAITLNESSNGIYFPLEEIAKLRQMFPNALIGVDTVSDTPYTLLDYNNLDFFYFSVQKCFGLPPGLGVWVVNNKCVSRAKILESNQQFIGTYRRLPLMVKKSLDFQTIETPNILNIYLLGKVAHDMITKGINVIRDEIDKKYEHINHFVLRSNNSNNFFVMNENNRSRTVIVLETKKSKKICQFMEKNGFLIASGYGQFRDKHIRIGNFPSHSIKSVKKIVDLLGVC